MKGRPVKHRLPLLILPVAALAACEAVQEAEEEVDEEIAEGLEHAGEAIERVLPDELFASDDLKQAMKEEEGEIDVVYRDLTGKPTVGVGHLVRPEDRLAVGQRVSREKIDKFLDDDIRWAEDEVRKIAKDTPLHQHEFDALVDLVFNVGPGNVSPDKSPGLNDGLKSRDYRKVAENLIYSRDANGRPARGLRFRSDRRRQIFEKGDYADPRR